MVIDDPTTVTPTSPTTDHSGLATISRGDTPSETCTHEDSSSDASSSSVISEYQDVEDAPHVTSKVSHEDVTEKKTNRPSLAIFKTNIRQQSQLSTTSKTSNNINDNTAENNNCSDCDKKLSAWSAGCVLVNLISVGYILLPSVFAQGGVLLSSICLFFVAVQSYITGTFVLQACARAEAWEHFVNSSFLQLSFRSKRNAVGGYAMTIRQRKYELSELCRLFMGRKVRNFFTFTTAGDLYGISWTLASVFASAMAKNFPLLANKIGDDYDDDSDDSNSYKIYVLIFMAITVPLSCLQLSDQLILQMIFLAGRTVMYLLMVITACIASVSDKSHFGTQVGPTSDPPPLFNFSTFILVVQSCIFATAFQFSVPGLTSESKHKSKMKQVVGSSVTYIYLSNLILSLILSIFFGASTSQSSNLNWSDYHGGSWDGVGELRVERALWSKIISGYVVLYAALDGLAVFPLLAISLGDIMMDAIYEDKVHQMQKDWKRRSIFRILASSPQCIGAIFVNDLGIIAKLAGIFTLCSYTLCPSLLAISSRRKLEEADIPANTNFETIFSSHWWPWLLSALSLLLALAVMIEVATTWE